MAPDSALNCTIAGNSLELSPVGAWTAAYSQTLDARLTAVAPQISAARNLTINMAGVRELDTLGAWLLERLVRSCVQRKIEVQFLGLPDRYRGLFDQVSRVNRRTGEPAAGKNIFVASLERVGQSAIALFAELITFLDMLAALSFAAARVLVRPRNFRITSAVYHLYRVGWQAIPIIFLITFLIGCIIAQQGFFHFRKFGADAYVVDMVGILVLREIGVLIVSIMVAGRSGSAYTAELGSMKMREEIDALRMMGFDPVEVLILPRADSARHRIANPGFPWRNCRSLRRGSDCLALWRHESRNIYCTLARSGVCHPLRGGHDQSALHGFGYRARGLQRGASCQRQCRVARLADDKLCRKIYFPRHRARRHIRDVFCVNRDVT